MSTLLRTTVVEARLFLREPTAAILGVLSPTLILLVLGAVPALREPSKEYDGARFVELWAPSALVLGIGVVALQHVTGVLATYRENGVLRRLSTTPVHPGKLLLAQLIVALVACLVAGALLVGAAWLVLDVPLPRHPLTFVAAFAVGFGAVLAIGALIAAVAPSSRVAGGLATLVYMVVMFAGGVFLPRFLMPDALVRMGDYTPPGVQALLTAWSGNPAVLATVDAGTGGTRIVQLAIMALVAVAAGLAAAKLFRWE
ncbi:ABC transporter permease [Micromonospora sp. CPCC 206061]|uniref:ABC transporter permease n=1 Tax=Micromonospora sp. CPCC 206061 TaxID=3122410 RepID=UPI002FF4151B